MGVTPNPKIALAKTDFFKHERYRMGKKWLPTPKQECDFAFQRGGDLRRHKSQFIKFLDFFFTDFWLTQRDAQALRKRRLEFF